MVRGRRKRSLVSGQGALWIGLRCSSSGRGSLWHENRVQIVNVSSSLYFALDSGVRSRVYAFHMPQGSETLKNTILHWQTVSPDLTGAEPSAKNISNPPTHSRREAARICRRLYHRALAARRQSNLGRQRHWADSRHASLSDNSCQR